MATLNHKTSTSADISSRSPRSVLRDELGDLAELLDNLPVHSVNLVVNNNHDDPAYKDERIEVGTLLEDGVERKLWAVMKRRLSAEDGLPSVRVFGLKSAASEPDVYSPNQVLAKGRLRDEFKVLQDCDYNALTVVIKVFFILKGVELPSNYSFTKHFIGILTKVCRSYRDSARRVRSSHRSPSNERTSPRGEINSPRAMMHKTEQQGPEYQVFGASLTRSNRSASPVSTGGSFPNYVPPFRPTVKGVEDTEGAHLSTGNFSRTENMMNKLPHAGEISMEDPDSVATSVVKPVGLLEQMTTSEEPIKSEHQDPGTCIAQSLTPAPPLIGTMAMNLATPQVPVMPASMGSVFDYLEIQRERAQLNDDIRYIERKIAKLAEDILKRQNKLVNQIQEKRRVLEEWKIKQEDGFTALEAKDAELKQEQEQHTKILLQQQEAKIARNDEVKRAVGEKHKPFPVESLVDFISSKNKKVKCEGSGDVV